jgi:hypothetical protein
MCKNKGISYPIREPLIARLARESFMHLRRTQAHEYVRTGQSPVRVRTGTWGAGNGLKVRPQFFTHAAAPQALISWQNRNAHKKRILI